mmetsp:Transcript_33383/g.93679  ORF Transcript_33383/g.93679 Transcript_33383/m.93679 type:complete len:254 (+) Transcript_33383:282-1043(+)
MQEGERERGFARGPVEQVPQLGDIRLGVGRGHQVGQCLRDVRDAGRKRARKHLQRLAHLAEREPVTHLKRQQGADAPRDGDVLAPLGGEPLRALGRRVRVLVRDFELQAVLGVEPSHHAVHFVPDQQDQQPPHLLQELLAVHRHALRGRTGGQTCAVKGRLRVRVPSLVQNRRADGPPPLALLAVQPKVVAVEPRPGRVGAARPRGRPAPPRPRSNAFRLQICQHVTKPLAAVLRGGGPGVLFSLQSARAVRR